MRFKNDFRSKFLMDSRKDYEMVTIVRFHLR